MSPQAFQVLLALADEPRHGYAIIQDVAARTSGSMRLTASTLYAVLKRLLDTRLIEERDAPEGVDARRRYYRLTRAGLAAGRAEAARLQAFAAMAADKRWLRKPAR